MREKTLSDYTEFVQESQNARALVRYAKRGAAGPESRVNGGPSPIHVDAAFERYEKTAIDAATTGNTAALLRASRDFLKVVARHTILGQMSGSTMPVPPFTSVVGLSGDFDPVPAWLAEGAPTPVARGSSVDLVAVVCKIGLIVAISRELARASDERATTLLERVLIRALRRAEDRLLLGDYAAVPQERPQGLLHGVSALNTASPDIISPDMEQLWTSVKDGDSLSPYYIISPRGGAYLSSLHDSGVPRFPNVGPLGGDISGVPVISSRAAGSKLVLLDASELIVTDEGAIVEASQVASIQMDDAPSGGAAVHVSAWQGGLTFIKMTRYLHWVLASADAVGYLELPINGSPV